MLEGRVNLLLMLSETQNKMDHPFTREEFRRYRLEELRKESNPKIYQEEWIASMRELESERSEKEVEKPKSPRYKRKDGYEWTTEDMLHDPNRVPYTGISPPNSEEAVVLHDLIGPRKRPKWTVDKRPIPVIRKEWEDWKNGIIHTGVRDHWEPEVKYKTLKAYGNAVLRLFCGKKKPREKLEEDELIMVPAEAIGPRRPLEEEEYYHGFMRDAEAESIFQEYNFKNGSFLVRRAQSYTGLVYVISVRTANRKIFNMLINVTDEDRLYWLDNHAFTTIQQLVEFYVDSRIPLHIFIGGMRRNEQEVILKYPIKRFSWQIKPEQIELDALLGSGEFGEVYKGYLEVSFSIGRKPVAVKTLKGEKLTTQQIYDLTKEADNMKELYHPNVIKFYGIAAAREPFMIALEFCPGGALDERLEKTKTTDFQKIRFLYHAACGIDYLHQAEITHGDIAARNCLLSANDVLKIGDFGLSTETEGSKCKEGKVPVRYMAPEAVEKMIVTKESDAWAFSALIFEIFHRAFGPYHEYDPLEKVKDFLRKDEVHMYLFERPKVEKIPHGLRVDVKKWSLSLDKPERPQIQAKIEFLFKRLRFRNLNCRLTFERKDKFKGFEMPGIVETLEGMMKTYEIEDTFIEDR